MTAKAVRGAARLTDMAALPVLDDGVRVGYEGSISKAGDNADWDWGLYQDERGEWVLMEADGPGCIFNFTQHRYPTSETPVFRFYFDYAEQPQFTITPAEFGEKAPFLRPLADKYVGPDDNGRGPIWVVRSFVPMAFAAHCKITSSVKLEGAEKAKGEGGWGHVTYQLYPDAAGLEPFDPTMDMAALAQRYAEGLPAAGHAAAQGGFRLPAGGVRTVLDENGRGAVTAVRTVLKDFNPAQLGSLWIRLFYDGYEAPFVQAPLGTFFGCEYGMTPAALRTALLTFDITGPDAVLENRFPQPFFRGVRVELQNRGEHEAVFADMTVNIDSAADYDPQNTGYFTASPYYPKTPNRPGENSVIADLAGSGHMAYGVLTGYGIASGGCEGDVRVFIDDGRSPVIESDGSESWASYGWGFVTPPQANPFSAYNGAPEVNSDWSEVRLTFTDSYPFRRRLRFELEHGDRNDGGGCHSGQVFAYMRPEGRIGMVPCGEYGPGLPGYCTDGTAAPVHDRFENGIHERYADFTCVSGMRETVLAVPLPADNRGVYLQRVSMQDRGPMEALVLADGREAPAHWLYPDGNPHYRLLEDAYLLPQALTRGKTRLEISIRPLRESWNECRYRVYALTPEGTDD